MPTPDEPEIKVINDPDEAAKLFKSLKAKSRGVKKARKKKPERLFLTPSIEVPPELIAAKQKLIDDVFGGQQEWQKALNAGKKRGGPIGLENICGIYIGQKKSKGKPTAQLCVVVEVLKKADKEKIARDCKIPPKIKIGKTWVLTDIQVGKMVTPHSALAGEMCSVDRVGAGSGRIEGGTIGYTCSVKSGGSFYGCIISNSHVLGVFLNPAVQENDQVFDNFAPSGDLIGLYFKSGGDGLDAALAWIKGDGVAMHKRRGFDVTGLVPDDASMPSSGQRVKAYGTKTQAVRFGVVGNVDVVKTVNYPNVGVKTVQHCFTINSLDGSPFSASGDSGSAVVDANTGQPLGLLIGSDGAEGSPNSVAHYIGFVLDGLEIAKILDATEQ